eukprot:3308936-Rhodomonas_salina.1
MAQSASDIAQHEHCRSTRIGRSVRGKEEGHFGGKEGERKGLVRVRLREEAVSYTHLTLPTICSV